MIMSTTDHRIGNLWRFLVSPGDPSITCPTFRLAFNWPTKLSGAKFNYSNCGLMPQRACPCPLFTRRARKTHYRTRSLQQETCMAYMRKACRGWDMQYTIHHLFIIEDARVPTPEPGTTATGSGYVFLSHGWTMESSIHARLIIEVICALIVEPGATLTDSGFCFYF